MRVQWNVHGTGISPAMRILGNGTLLSNLPRIGIYWEPTPSLVIQCIRYILQCDGNKRTCHIYFCGGSWGCFCFFLLLQGLRVSVCGCGCVCDHIIFVQPKWGLFLIYVREGAYISHYVNMLSVPLRIFLQTHYWQNIVKGGYIGCAMKPSEIISVAMCCVNHRSASWSCDKVNLQVWAVCLYSPYHLTSTHQKHSLS